jgi:hypothetical protein
MNSVISLDGNDIFAVARMFEKMNINELGDITESIPDEIKIFDQNSSAYGSTNTAWKSWVKEFYSLVGLIDAYAYKSDANSALKKKLPQTRMSKQQVNTAISNEREKVMKNENYANLMRNFKVQLNLLPIGVDFDSPTASEDLITNIENIASFLTDVSTDVNHNVFLISILLTEMKDMLDGKMDDYSEVLSDQSSSLYKEQFIDVILASIDEKIEENQNAMIEQVRTGIPEINQLKTTVNETLQSNLSSAIITELSSLKDAIPIINSLNEKLAINLVEWKQLVGTGSFNLEKSDDSDFNYKIESDTKEMIEILNKYKRDTKVYKDAFKELEKLQGQINNLLTNQGGVKQVANTVPYVNIDTQKPIRFLASDYDAGDAGDDDDSDDEDYVSVEEYHRTNMEVLEEGGRYDDWVNSMKKEGKGDDPIDVGKVKTPNLERLLKRIGIGSLEEFNAISKNDLKGIARDLELDFGSKILINPLRVKILRRLLVDDKFINFND